MKTTYKVLVCLNNFKGSLSNQEATRLIAETLRKEGHTAEEWPIGDGGSGTLWAFHCIRGGTFHSFPSSSPLSTPVTARVLCLPDDKSPKSIYIESSQVCGYELVPQEKRDAFSATSLGLGQLIRLVSEKWKDSVQEILIGLGDSAISDVGIGMLSGLGFQFFDKTEREVPPVTAHLSDVHSLRPPHLSSMKHIRWTVLCDVSNPLCGDEGSARVFSPQKGATPEQVKRIERGMENFGGVLERFSGKAIRSTPRTGSAGGVSAALYACLGAKLVSGASFLFDEAHFDKRIQDYDLVITGEGKTDAQTLKGKAPKECLERTARAGKKILFLSGMLGEGYEAILRYPNVLGCYACGKIPDARSAIVRTMEEIMASDGLYARQA